MDAVRITVLREALEGTGWLEATHGFARTLRLAVTRKRSAPGGLLLVGTDREDPWHLAAHLTDEAAWSGVPELTPTLLRQSFPTDAPPHLSVPLTRLDGTGRGETVFMVAPRAPHEDLLERVADARRAGATILSLETQPGELTALSHESLTAPESALPFDLTQHLISTAAGERPRSRGSRVRDLLDKLTTPPPLRW
jgi:hypothetical protein